MDGFWQGGRSFNLLHYPPDAAGPSNAVMGRTLDGSGGPLHLRPPPFGSLKHRAGMHHFLMGGLESAGGKLSLMVFHSLIPYGTRSHDGPASCEVALAGARTQSPRSTIFAVLGSST